MIVPVERVVLVLALRLDDEVEGGGGPPRHIGPFLVDLLRALSLEAKIAAAVGTSSATASSKSAIIAPRRSLSTIRATIASACPRWAALGSIKRKANKLNGVPGAMKLRTGHSSSRSLVVAAGEAGTPLTA